MKQKKLIIIIALATVLLGGGWYGYSEYNRKVKDLSRVKADVVLDAKTLIQSFEKDEAASNVNYLDKIIAVKGNVKAVEKNDQGHVTVILGEEDGMSSVRCSMDSTHQGDVVSLSRGKMLTMKGACTGFNADELLGSDVILNRCVIEK